MQVEFKSKSKSDCNLKIMSLFFIGTSSNLLAGLQIRLKSTKYMSNVMWATGKQPDLIYRCFICLFNQNVSERLEFSELVIVVQLSVWMQ